MIFHRPKAELKAATINLDAAIDRAQRAERRAEDAERRLSDRAYLCSFCDKSEHDVKRLIAGPKVFICNECVLLCTSICMDANQSE